MMASRPSMLLRWTQAYRQPFVKKSFGNARSGYTNTMVWRTARTFCKKSVTKKTNKFTTTELSSLRAVFDTLCGEDGTIRGEDLKRAFVHYNLSTPQNRELDAMIAEADENSSGAVDWDEFLAQLSRSRSEGVASTSRFGQFVLRVQAQREVTSGRNTLEVKDADLLFDETWMNLERRHGADSLYLPSEIVFLGGAPGSGKGTHTPFIAQARGISEATVVISDLLGEQFSSVKKSGALVTDRVVAELLFEKLLEPQFERGVIVDGFPRTEVQVAIVQRLRSKMFELRQQYAANPELSAKFARPRFRVVVLFVEEEESVFRQMERGRRVREHNEKVRASGMGELVPERPTDGDESVARKRYAEFVKHYRSIEKMRELFDFTVINASGSISEVQQAIEHEFAYQSANELREDTFEAVCHIPLAQEITHFARQDLVARLDSYAQKEPKLFKKVIEFIDERIIPVIKRTAISGEARIPLVGDVYFNQEALWMTIDVLSERGYHAFNTNSILHVKWAAQHIRNKNSLEVAFTH